MRLAKLQTDYKLWRQRAHESIQIAKKTEVVELQGIKQTIFLYTYGLTWLALKTVSPFVAVIAPVCDISQNSRVCRLIVSLTLTISFSKSFAQSHSLLKCVC